METFKDRLVFLWKSEARQAKIASDIEMTIAGFSRIWNEGGLPKSETLKKIKQLKGCSIDWLLTGEGNPFPDEAPKNPLLTIPWEMKLIRTSLSLCRDMIFGRLRDTGSLSVMRNRYLQWRSDGIGLRIMLPEIRKTCL